MTVRVLSGPSPLVTPSDVPGSHAGDDPMVLALIAAVQATMDGPTGWLGRSLGAQTIEMTTDFFCRYMSLPFFPVTGVSSVKYYDAAGIEQTVDPANYYISGDDLVFRAAFTLPSSAGHLGRNHITILYEAGYTTPPPSAKAAVIIGVQHLKTMTERSLFLRSDDVDGVGSQSFTVSEAAGATIKAATDFLLTPLWVPTL